MTDDRDRLTPAELGDGLPSAASLDVSFANLNDTEFEEFVYDLLVTLGFVNVDWRKGTPKNASPSDRGRDIVAQWVVKDVDGHTRFETWFVDAKHYARGVPPEALQGLMTWSEVERPDVALVAASGFLSNPAKDWVSAYVSNRSPGFRIRYWEKPDLSRMLSRFPDLMHRHGIIEAESMRTVADIRAAEHEFFDKVWYVRSLIHDENIAAGESDDLSADLRERVLAARAAVVERYGASDVGPWDDWTWGFVNGKLSALRWVLGDEWDFLDT
ncbi:restriction endonuclease [Curtobacterium sp. TC1]|uniref:restriction endonuclease n=1 Tax=Curtobacterium sp. TC1 TaxID=2862880 RepID=UPI001C9B0097|nr:restriction endonuclease [Curtobacterium sp. TC1]QZQ56709.1 restriction endonuclease [Curtobacterium sp. TC1]